MNMIEKVAREIEKWSAGELNYEGDCIPLAKAVIEAMREPTEEMIQAASVAGYGVTTDKDSNLHKLLKRTLPAAIDAALKE